MKERDHSATQPDPERGTGNDNALGRVEVRPGDPASDVTKAKALWELVEHPVLTTRSAKDPTERDRAYMKRALAVARTNPECPFGALLVDRTADRIVAVGVNRTRESPIWHGEIDALHRCASLHPSPDWARLELYTTAEPCPMCQAAILWAGIPRVVYGTSIATLRALGWSQIDLSAAELTARAPFAECEIVGGVLRAECDSLFRERDASSGSRREPTSDRFPAAPPLRGRSP